jgi:hypothetical protein
VHRWCSEHECRETSKRTHKQMNNNRRASFKSQTSTLTTTQTATADSAQPTADSGQPAAHPASITDDNFHTSHWVQPGCHGVRT